jgi:hypothetical protein
MGNQVGHVTGVNTIELLYQCLTIKGEILAGWSRGEVSQDHQGRTMLHFVWGWLSGATGEASLITSNWSTSLAICRTQQLPSVR